MKTNETTPIPQGYKATPLGIIPQEWEVKPLGEVGKLLSGLTYSPSNIRSNGLLVLRSSNIQEGQLVFEDNVFVDVLSYTPVKEGDILICVRNGSQNLIGKTAIITKKAEGCAFGAFMAIFRSPINQYIFYLFGTEIYRKYIYRNLGATINSINGSDLRRFRFPFPPLAEQKKIAEVLSVWDRAIEKQSQLIEQLTLRKRGLMQQLLTAKRRLPGFSEPWKTVRLGEIGHFLSSNTLSRDNLNEDNGNIRNIHYGDILIKLPTIVDLPFIHIPYINNGIVVKSDYLKDGDIIFADTAEDYTVGKAIEIINIGAALVTSGLHTIPFRPKCGIFVSRFLGYYVNSIAYQRQLQPLIQGIKVCSISKTALCTTVLKVPTLAEQTAIAEVLASADREIELAQQKLELLRQQKRGLMQQLLTGKKRVKL